jgi:branched-chain amino acid transport system substrate-binding protein
MEELGMAGFGPAFDVSCQNHGGPGLAYIQQWDADTQTWSLVTDLIASDRELIGKLVEEDAAAYAAENNITPACN